MQKLCPKCHKWVEATRSGVIYCHHTNSWSGPCAGGTKRHHTAAMLERVKLIIDNPFVSRTAPKPVELRVVGGTAAGTAVVPYDPKRGFGFP